MAHGPHETQPGYASEQILHPGCGECAERGRSLNVALSYMDTATFARAWARAAQFERGQARDVAAAEVHLLNGLSAVQCQLERLGVPVGALPAWVPA